MTKQERTFTERMLADPDVQVTIEEVAQREACEAELAEACDRIEKLEAQLDAILDYAHTQYERHQQDTEELTTYIDNAASRAERNDHVQNRAKHAYAREAYSSILAVAARYAPDETE